MVLLLRPDLLVLPVAPLVRPVGDTVDDGDDDAAPPAPLPLQVSPGVGVEGELERTVRP